MNPLDIIDQYYSRESEAYRILVAHGRDVAALSVALGKRYGGKERIDLDFVYEAAMLHDIGIMRCDAPAIGCYGDADYILHGHVGAEMLRLAGYPRHALVAERHTGTGLMLEEILQRDLPLPIDGIYYPTTAEERLICYADKFYSKTSLGQIKDRDRVLRSITCYGSDSRDRFLAMEQEFGSVEGL